MKTTLKMAAAMLLLAGCNEDNYDPDAEPALSISPEKQAIAFSAAATETFTFEVETNQPVWFAQSDQTWCKVEMDAEAGTFTVSATENTSVAAPEPATILVSAGKAGEITLTATQAGADEPTLAIDPAMEAIEFSADASEEFVFTVTTNQSSWTAESDQSWCRVAIDAEAGTFTVTAERNDTAAVPDPATVTVTAGEAAPILIAATQQAAGRYDVYLAGSFYTEGSREAVAYWKNGVRTQLTEGKAFALCFGIAASNGAIYVMGMDEMTNCYWKNDERFEVGEFDGEILSQAVENGSVYLLFNEFYWHDGTTVDCSPTGFTGKAIAVADGAVSVAGQVYLSVFGNSVNLAYVWKKGSGATPLSVPVESHQSDAVCATSAGGAIYIGGSYQDKNTGTNHPCYWKDGVCTTLDLPEGAIGGSVEHICVDEEGKVYAAGYYVGETDDYHCYWADGALTQLEFPAEAFNINVSGIAVAEGKVYVSSDFILGGQGYASYFMDGERFDLKLDDMYSVTTAGIAVVKSQS